MRKIAFNQICTLSLEFKNPERAKLVMRVFLERSLAHARVTVTRNLLQRCCAKKLVLNEVKYTVESIMGKLKSNLPKDPVRKKLESVIMNTKFSDAIKKQKESKSDLRNAKFKLDPIVRKGTFVRDFFYGDCSQGDHINLEHGEFQINQK